MRLMALALVLAAAAAPVRELRWRNGARVHVLKVGPPVLAGGSDAATMAALSIPGGTSSQTWKGEEGRDESSWEARSLLSVVGPIVSRHYAYNGYHGAGGWITEHIETELLDGYAFDLRAYLKKNGGIPAEAENADFRRFWIESWDGKDALVLGIEVSGCDNNRTTCTLQIASIPTRPPREWRPWLEAAKRGEGVIQEETIAWWTALHPDALAAARRTLKGLRGAKARRDWIAQRVYRQAGAPASAAALVEEFVPLDEKEVETAWAASDRLLYLTRADALDPVGPRKCPDAVREALGRAWPAVVTKAVLFNAFECVRSDPARSKDEQQRLDQARAACEPTSDPLGCARSALKPFLEPG